MQYASTRCQKNRKSRNSYRRRRMYRRDRRQDNDSKSSPIMWDLEPDLENAFASSRANPFDILKDLPQTYEPTKHGVEQDQLLPVSARPMYAEQKAITKLHHELTGSVANAPDLCDMSTLLNRGLLWTLTASPLITVKPRSDDGVENGGRDIAPIKSSQLESSTCGQRTRGELVSYSPLHKDWNAPVFRWQFSDDQSRELSKQSLNTLLFRKHSRYFPKQVNDGDQRMTLKTSNGHLAQAVLASETAPSSSAAEVNNAVAKSHFPLPDRSSQTCQSNPANLWSILAQQMAAQAMPVSIMNQISKDFTIQCRPAEQSNNVKDDATCAELDGKEIQHTQASSTNTLASSADYNTVSDIGSVVHHSQPPIASLDDDASSAALNELTIEEFEPLLSASALFTLAMATALPESRSSSPTPNHDESNAATISALNTQSSFRPNQDNQDSDHADSHVHNLEVEARVAKTVQTTRTSCCMTQTVASEHTPSAWCDDDCMVVPEDWDVVTFWDEASDVMIDWTTKMKDCDDALDEYAMGWVTL